MASSLEAVLREVARRIVPTEGEREKMRGLSERLSLRIEQILKRSAIQGAVTLQGSFARDTWISGETDLDIFTRFAPSMDRTEWIEKVLPEIRKGLKNFRVTERYAEHPFLEFHVNNIRVNIVPCYDVARGQWKSATDRTPYHTEFMKSNLTPELRLQARLLKKFAMGIGVYGAEIKIGGFSGMLIDTVALYYGTFVETLRQASSWIPGTSVEIGKPSSTTRPKRGSGSAELVVIDPVDPDRNLASAVRPDKLWSFVAAGRRFVRNPELQYFYPKTYVRKNRAQFAKLLRGKALAIIVVNFKHRVLVPDVLWGQLMRLERSLIELLSREEFIINRSRIWSDERTESAILLETSQTMLSSLRIQKGPPVSKGEDGEAFLKRHLAARDTVRGPWIDGDRWLVEKDRENASIATFIKKSLQEPSRLGLPKQIGETIPKSVTVLEGRTILRMLSRDGFDKALSEFLEAKPSWLRQA